MSQELNQQKQALQVMQIQLETLARFEPTKSFLEIQEKAQMMAKIVQDGEAAEKSAASPEA